MEPLRKIAAKVILSNTEFDGIVRTFCNLYKIENGESLFACNLIKYGVMVTIRNDDFASADEGKSVPVESYMSDIYLKREHTPEATIDNYGKNYKLNVVVTNNIEPTIQTVSEFYIDKSKLQAIIPAYNVINNGYVGGSDSGINRRSRRKNKNKKSRRKNKNKKSRRKKSS
jgi:hypothetical protein